LALIFLAAYAQNVLTMKYFETKSLLFLREQSIRAVTCSPERLIAAFSDVDFHQLFISEA
tara:strand:+ start:147 stop:326 length:180 start_codon:yes stop_codon:yes gene_type:complete